MITYKKNNFGVLRDNRKGPVVLPFLGYVPLISRLDRKYLYRAMRKLSDIYGPVAGFYAGPIQPMISVCSYEAVKEVLHNDDLNGRPESAVIQARTFFERLGINFSPLIWPCH